MGGRLAANDGEGDLTSKDKEAVRQQLTEQIFDARLSDLCSPADVMGCLFPCAIAATFSVGGKLPSSLNFCEHIRECKPGLHPSQSQSVACGLAVNFDRLLAMTVLDEDIDAVETARKSTIENQYNNINHKMIPCSAIITPSIYSCLRCTVSFDRLFV